MNKYKLELQKGKIYRIHSRNLPIAVYDGNGGFIGIRNKFGSNYLFTEYFGNHVLGTVTPKEEIGQIPDNIEVKESILIERGTGREIVWKTGEPQTFVDTGELAGKDVDKCVISYPPLFEFLTQLYKDNGLWVKPTYSDLEDD